MLSSALAACIHYLNWRGLEVLHGLYVQGDDKCSLAGVVIREFLARSCLDHGLLWSESHERGSNSTLLLREIVLRELQAHFKSKPSSGPSLGLP